MSLRKISQPVHVYHHLASHHDSDAQHCAWLRASTLCSSHLHEQLLVLADDWVPHPTQVSRMEQESVEGQMFVKLKNTSSDELVQSEYFHKAGSRQEYALVILESWPESTSTSSWDRENNPDMIFGFSGFKNHDNYYLKYRKSQNHTFLLEECPHCPFKVLNIFLERHTRYSLYVVCPPVNQVPSWLSLSLNHTNTRCHFQGRHVKVKYLKPRSI